MGKAKRTDVSKETAIAQGEAKARKLQALQKEAAQAIEKVLSKDFYIVSVVAVHKSIPEQPIVFSRGHIYDIAAVSVQVARLYKKRIEGDLSIGS